MLARVLFVLVALSSVVHAEPADPYAALRDRIATIVGGAYDGAAVAQLTELGDVAGPRVTGSKTYEKSVEWAVAQLKAAGAQNVHLEKFTMPARWERGTAKARLISPRAKSLRLESIGWAPSTAGNVRGAVVLVKDLGTLPSDLKGKIALVEALPDGTDARPWVEILKAIAALETSGVRVVLFTQRRPNSLLSTGSFTNDGTIGAIPMASLGHEDARLLARLSETGPVTIEVEIKNKVSGPVEVANVIGEIPGRSKSWLLLGAHLDAWDFASGTQDNGSGVVTVIQAARLLASAGPLERTVRVALWGGEEQGLLGSHAYALAHESELATCVLALNTDEGAGHARGWELQGRDDVKAALDPIAKHVLAPLGGSTLDESRSASTDHFSFLQAGVPSLTLLVDRDEYHLAHHTPADTIDLVDAHALASGIAVLTVTAFVVATSPEPFAPRLDRPALEKLLEPGQYVELLKLTGWWK